jgi:hypothetical protein
VVVGSGGLPLLAPIAIVDSYNSANGPYASGGAKAIVWTNSTQSGSVTVNTNSVLNGSVLAGPGSLLSSIVNLLGALLGGGGGGGTVSASSETRTTGTVLPPNMSGLTDQGSFSSSTASPAPGVYDSMTFTSHTGTTLNLQSGVYQVLNNLSVGTLVHLSVPTATNAVIYVNGNISMGSGSSITVQGTGTLTIYAGASVTLTSATLSASGTNPSTAAVQLLGLPNSNSIQITGSSKLFGVVYAPQASVVMQTGSPVVYGAVVAHDFSVLNTGQFHFDEATKGVKLSNVVGGSAPPGSADYTYKTAGSY